MKIRKLETNDIETVVALWYETSVLAHDFITADYWEKNKEMMAKQYLPNSETHLMLEGDHIVGFIAMVDNFLAAIFVRPSKQGNGYGKELLNHIKERKTVIQLKVYKKNLKSVRFYQKQGFKPLSENRDENTNEMELLMEWNK